LSEQFIRALHLSASFIPVSRVVLFVYADSHTHQRIMLKYEDCSDLQMTLEAGVI